MWTDVAVFVIAVGMGYMWYKGHEAFTMWAVFWLLGTLVTRQAHRYGY